MSEDSVEEKTRRFLDLVHQASIRLAARGRRFVLVDATKRSTPGAESAIPAVKTAVIPSELKRRDP